MLEPDILRQRPKQRNALANQNRHASNNQLLNQPFAQESLNGYSSIYIDVANPATLKL
jgi:hypothetical protein